MGGLEKGGRGEGGRLQCRKTPAERRCTGRGPGEVVVETIGVPWFLDDLRAALRDCGPGRPGSAEAVLEPVFEAGLEPVSQGRRAWVHRHTASLLTAMSERPIFGLGEVDTQAFPASGSGEDAELTALEAHRQHDKGSALAVRMPSLEQPPKPAGRGPARTLAECALFSAAIVLVRVKVMAAPAQRLTTRLPHGAPVSARLRPMSVSLPDDLVIPQVTPA